MASFARCLKCAPPSRFSVGSRWAAYDARLQLEIRCYLDGSDIILFLQTVPPTVIRWTLPLWSIGTLAVNLTMYAMPQAIYPLHKYERQLESLHSKDDLILYFASYRGTHYLALFRCAELAAHDD